jgi:hypothetical protein
MTRYVPAPYYLWFGLSAVVLAGLCAWLGLALAPTVPAFVVSFLFLLSAGLLLAMAFRPGIEIHEGYLAIGRRTIPWMDIRRVDRTGWVSPLVVRVTLFDDSRFLMIYPGDADECASLLKRLRQFSRDALIDGTPYRQYWGEMTSGQDRKKTVPPPRYRLLRPEDEAEVERLYQRLKTVGNLDQKNSTDEN